MHSFALSTLVLALGVSQVTAFPSSLGKLVESNLAGRGLRERRAAAAPQGAGFLPLTPPPFDAAQQYRSNQGQHAFVAPGPGDARGPCPGLNALANHNYLPHNGVATIAQFTQATNYVFGMSLDLASLLSVFGAVLDGDLLGWSIEGGPRTGIGGSHNNYEGDSSGMMSDLNQYGSNDRLILEQFHELYDLQPDASTANYNLEALRKFRGTRFSESVAKNPYFTYLPTTGIQVSQAAFTFVYRFMSNKSAEYPEGRLDKDTLKSFFSVHGPENNLAWVKGYERIPDNWYTRNAADQYSVAYFQTDVVAFAATQPEILTTGCNQGAVNTYLTVSPETISNGAYQASDVLANPICYSLEVMKSSGPSLLGLDLSPLLNVIAPIVAALNCKPFNGAANLGAFAACPGFSAYGGPTGPIAPGAIRN